MRSSIMDTGIRGAVGLAMLVLLAAIAGAGCAKAARQAEVKDAIADYHVGKLFEVDGITVYRFYDTGNWHYLASRGSVQSRVSAGKNNTRPDGLVTVEAP